MEQKLGYLGRRLASVHSQRKPGIKSENYVAALSLFCGVGHISTQTVPNYPALVSRSTDYLERDAGFIRAEIKRVLTEDNIDFIVKGIVDRLRPYVLKSMSYTLVPIHRLNVVRAKEPRLYEGLENSFIYFRNPVGSSIPDVIIDDIRSLTAHIIARYQDHRNVLASSVEFLKARKAGQDLPTALADSDTQAHIARATLDVIVSDMLEEERNGAAYDETHFLRVQNISFLIQKLETLVSSIPDLTFPLLQKSQTMYHWDQFIAWCESLKMVQTLENDVNYRNIPIGRMMQISAKTGKWSLIVEPIWNRIWYTDPSETSVTIQGQQIPVTMPGSVVPGAIDEKALVTDQPIEMLGLEMNVQVAQSRIPSEAYRALDNHWRRVDGISDYLLPEGNVDLQSLESGSHDSVLRIMIGDQLCTLFPVPSTFVAGGITYYDVLAHPSINLNSDGVTFGSNFLTLREIASEVGYTPKPQVAYVSPPWTMA